MPLLTNWSPFAATSFATMLDELAQWQDAWNRSFASWPSSESPMLAAGYPALNIWQDDAHVYAEAELPGIALNQLEIFVTGENELTIKGTREPACDMKKCTCLRQERGSGAFTRIQQLPFAVQAAKVEARLEHGVLYIKMPKTEAAKPRLIPIQAG